MHEDYDGAPDSMDIRCGTAESETAAVMAIIEIHETLEAESAVPEEKESDG